MSAAKVPGVGGSAAAAGVVFIPRRTIDGLGWLSSRGFWFCVARTTQKFSQFNFGPRRGTPRCVRNFDSIHLPELVDVVLACHECRILTFRRNFFSSVILILFNHIWLDSV